MPADTILSQVEKMAKQESECPPGYERIIMTTKGLYGAPQVLHIRNFSVEEALQLSMVPQDELPIKITSLMQQIVLEPDVQIVDFFDQEVSELMIHFYQKFYQSYLKDQPYQITKEDIEWAKKEMFKGQDSQELQNWVRGCKTGNIPLKYDIDLRKVRYYDVGEKATKLIRCRSKRDPSFEAIFQYPKFGDAAILQRAIKEKYRAADRQWGPLYENYRTKIDLENRRRQGESIDPAAIPYIEQEDLNAVRSYEAEKTAYVVSQMKGLYLVSLNGQDLSGKDISERVELAKDPRIDYTMYQNVQKTFNELKIGPVPKIQITNPVNGELVEIDHPFRALDLLAAIKDYGSDDAIIESI